MLTKQQDLPLRLCPSSRMVAISFPGSLRARTNRTICELRPRSCYPRHLLDYIKQAAFFAELLRNSYGYLGAPSVQWYLSDKLHLRRLCSSFSSPRTVWPPFSFPLLACRLARDQHWRRIWHRRPCTGSRSIRMSSRLISGVKIAHFSSLRPCDWLSVQISGRLR